MADEGKKTVPRGRGTLLLETLRKFQTRPGDEPGTSLEAEKPPKPKGRAALLQKLAEYAQSQVGSGDEAVGSSAQSITESLASTSISQSTTETCSYLGTSGTQIPISCNYIQLTVDADKGVFEYNVQFNPEVDAKAVRRKLTQVVGKVKMFDGGNILYLPTKLPEIKNVYDCVHPNDDSKVTMTITFVKKKKLGECLHLFNVLFKRIMGILLYSRIGQNYYDPNHTHLIPQHKLEVLPGYAVSVDEYEGGVMICCDTQHRVLRVQTVLDVMIDLRQMCKERFKEAVTQALIGVVTITRYNNKTYRIDDILWDANPQSTFTTADGRKISYIDYYKAQYGLIIKDTKQPLLLNMQNKRMPGELKKTERLICLVPELCNLTGLTDDMRSDFKIMKDVAMYTKVSPNQRMNALRTYIENIKKSPAALQVLSDWGLQIQNATIDLMARVLSPEIILFGQGLCAPANEGDWNNLVTKNKVLGPIDLCKWILFYTKRDERNSLQFAETIVRIASPMGMRIQKPILQLLKDDRTDTYVNVIKNAITPEIQALVFICPTSRDDRYSTIKRICCAHMPIATQVINSRTLSNPTKVRTIIQKIALQINCKLGGTLWSVRFPFSNWMICGIDVYHSTSTKQSVCAFISSLNESMTRWWNTTIFQDKELGDHLKMAFLKALEKHREINGTFPANVIIYRDGVGDGQLKHCLEYEVAQFEQALKDYEATHIKITMIIVQKRINTRIFLANGKNHLDFENAQPGTIVDHTITKRNWYDFFLVPQKVRQGTVTPTHYVVLYDTAKLKPDHVQKLTYKLCHLYFNWAGTIRVPAPCQYAHKLAYLVGQHIHKVPSTALGDRLFYL